MCAKCPPTRDLLLRVAADDPYVAHIEIDASEHLDLARRLDIMRTPTTLVLDADGVVVSRMNGAPTEAQAREALAEVPPPTEYSI
ncbi:MAG: thioredoxin family protein [Demequinaceae bacterium]|nr:thioredoxin family protein [Demequinaceae bacterium]